MEPSPSTIPTPNPTPNPSGSVSNEETNALSEGLLSLLTPIVQDCDDRIHDVLETQIELATQIDLLTAGKE
jgi:hypothetical protein